MKINKYFVVFLDTTNSEDPLIRNQIYETDKNMEELIRWLLNEEQPNYSPKYKVFSILNIIKLN